MKSKFLYALINSLFLLSGILCFCGFLQDFSVSFFSTNYFILLISFAGVIYLLKAFRLYFLFAGNGIELFKFLKVYSKTTFVNIMLPFKIGEIFRFYCFGNLTKNYMKGLLIILLERFIDIFSIFIVVFVSILFGEKYGGNLLKFLFVIEFILLFFYLIIPGMVDYWKNYFIKSNSSKRHYTALVFVENLKIVFKEINILAKGRFVPILLISIVTWSLEFLLLVLTNKFFINSSEKQISDYLNSTLLGNSFPLLNNFLIISAFIMILSFLSVSFIQFVKNIGDKNGK